MAVGGIRAERMDPADVAWLHMDRPVNLMVVNTVQRPLVPGKQRAWTRPVPVEAVRAAAAAAGGTVNDLMLTAITSALRRYLLEHDALADEVIVIVPVNMKIRAASQVTLCLTSSVPSVWMDLTERGLAQPGHLREPGPWHCGGGRRAPPAPAWQS